MSSHCLPSILILKASRKLCEGVLSAHASMLRRRDQNCIFHHQCAINPYKGSRESIHTKPSLPRCPQSWEVSHIWLPPHSHQLSLMMRMNSSSLPTPAWCPATAVTADPIGEESVRYPPSMGVGQPGTHHQPPASPGDLQVWDLVCWLMQTLQRDSSWQQLVMSHRAQLRVTLGLSQVHCGTTLCFPVPGQIPSLLRTLNSIYLLEELHQFLQS